MIVVTSFRIELKGRVLRRRLRNDVDNPADGVGSVFCGRCAANDFNALNIFRTYAHRFVATAHVLGYVT